MALHSFPAKKKNPSGFRHKRDFAVCLRILKSIQFRYSSGCCLCRCCSRIRFRASFCSSHHSRKLPELPSRFVRGFPGQKTHQRF